MKQSNKIMFISSAAVCVSVLTIFLSGVICPFSVCANPTSAIVAKGNMTQKTIIGNGQALTKSYNVKAFDKINIGGNFVVNITQGNQTSIAVSADSNLLPYIHITSVNNQLNIASQNGIKLTSTKPIVINITTPNIKKLNIGGNSTIKASNLNTKELKINLGGNDKSTLSGNIKDLKISIGGNSKINANVNSKNIVLNIGGDGDITLSGNTKTLSVKSGGNANINAKQLTAKQVTINGAGLINASFHVTEKLNIATFGATNISYIGNPEISKAGFGKITLKQIQG